MPEPERKLGSYGDIHQRMDGLKVLQHAEILGWMATGYTLRYKEQLTIKQSHELENGLFVVKFDFEVGSGK